VAAYAGRAECYIGEGNPAPAVRDYDQALRLSPADPDLYLERGNAHEQIGNRSAARTDLMEIAKLPSVNPDQIVRAAQGLTAMGFYTDALALVKFGLDHYGGVSELFMRRAELEVLVGDDASALKDFNSAIQRASGKQLAAVLSARADYYRLRQQYKAAVADYGQAIGLDPANYSIYSGRAKALTNLGSLSAAERDYGLAISLYGDVTSRNTWPLATLYENRGIVRTQTGQRAMAVSDFEKALAILSNTGPASWISRLKGEISSATG
jgi:serine/threonine-protein kinase